MAKSKEIEVKKKGEGAVSPLPQSMLGLRHEIDRAFDRFFDNGWLSGFRAPWGGLGDLKIDSEFSETDDGYALSLEVPGMEEKDVDVSVSDDTITIKGEKRESTEKKEKDYHLTERRYGSFQRVFTLPRGVNIEAIQAKLAKGVLEINMPKTKEAQARKRKVDVKSA
ncbi:MAG: Hsp20/alpha crystallin family protein [Gammaproteobacteria bacterium]|nr:Hsp20/alpha crystallin family protein [Gammaproteobacteria bacterium]